MNSTARILERANRFAVSSGARVLQLAFGFVSVVLLARYLPPNVLGQFYLASAIAIGASLSLFSFLHFPIQRLMPGEEARGLAFCGALTFPVALGGVTALLLALVAHLMQAGTASLALLTVSMMAGEVAFSQATNMTSAVRAPSSYFKLVAARSILVLALLYALLSAGPSAQRALAAYSAGGLLASFLVTSRAIRQFISSRSNLRPIRQCFDFAWPMILSQALRQLTERGDRFLVAATLGVSAAGIYSVMVDLCRRAIQGIAINARLVFVRDAIDAFDRDDQAKLAGATRTIAISIALVVVPIALCISIFGPSLAPLLFSKRVESDAASVFWLLASAFAMESFRLYLFSLPFELSKNVKPDFLISLIGAISISLLIPFLATQFGFHGAAAAVVVTQSLMLLSTLAISRQLVPMKIPAGDTLSSVILLVAFSYCSTLFLPSIVDPRTNSYPVAVAIAYVLICTPLAMVGFLVTRNHEAT